MADNLDKTKLKTIESKDHKRFDETIINAMPIVMKSPIVAGMMKALLTKKKK